MTVFANAMQALAQRLAAALDPIKVEVNREVPTGLPDPTEENPTYYIVLHDGPVEFDKGISSNRQRAWRMRPTVHIEARTKTAAAALDALYGMLERIDEVIMSDRFLGLNSSAGIVDAQVEGSEPEIYDAEAASPGGALEVAVVLSVRTSNLNLRVAA